MPTALHTPGPTGVQLTHSQTGGVAEWFKALVLKTSEGGTLP